MSVSLDSSEELKGLSSEEAKRLLEQYGPNEIVEEHPNLFLLFFKKIMGTHPMDA